MEIQRDYEPISKRVTLADGRTIVLFVDPYRNHVVLHVIGDEGGKVLFDELVQPAHAQMEK